MLEQDNLKQKIALTLIPGVGDRMLKALLSYFGSVEAIFNANASDLASLPRVGSKLSGFRTNKSLMERAEKEAAFVLKNHIKVSFYLDKDYPYRLKDCNDGPVLIYYQGNMNLNSDRIISIVGTRNSTAYGKRLVANVINELSDFDSKIVVVSGMAYGIDILAHRACANHQMQTIGVLAHGLDRLYPSVHREAAKKMMKNGGLLSEFPSETNPDPQNFVKRNRIVAGLSDATLVIESGLKGGALITTNIASSYNRDVFAFPGEVGAPFSSGCNWLIKTNQAAMIENAKDLVAQMNWIKKKNNNNPVQTSLFQELTDDEKQIFDLLRQKGEMALNFISLALNQPISKTSVILFNMEMKGMLQVQPGNVYRLI